MKSLLERETFPPNKSIAPVWLGHGAELDLSVSTVFCVSTSQRCSQSTSEI